MDNDDPKTPAIRQSSNKSDAVAETLRCILPPSKHIPCDNPSPFRRKPFRLKLGQDGRLDAHPYGIFHVVEKDLNQSHRPAQN